MKLYDYFRSSAAYRVRIVINLKGLDVEQVPIHLVRDGGQHKTQGYAGKNPQMLLPALELSDDVVLNQSLAICEYLNEKYPDPPLLPDDMIARAKVRALCQMIACDIHPLNNLRVLNYLKGPLAHTPEQVEDWYRYWITETFAAVEQVIGEDGYCYGGRASLADTCLIPQIFNARRFSTDMSPYPKIEKVEQTCGQTAAFADAHPSVQPDAE